MVSNTGTAGDLVLPLDALKFFKSESEPTSHGGGAGEMSNGDSTKILPSVFFALTTHTPLIKGVEVHPSN